MNTSKKIYFLSAFVLIIGCFALNLSYSLFVQTEEKEIVNASIPSLAYSLETSTFTVPANSKKIITLNIKNSGSANINYGISLNETLTDNQLVQLVDIDGNDIIGEVLADSTKEETIKEVKLYVENNESTDLVLNFSLQANYTTLNLDYKIDSKIIREPKYNNFLNKIIMKDTRIVKNEGTPEFTGVETNEVGMYSAEDDYGTSWYFRGAQPYNYVNFAGFTWRIVRINGDGSIRLILDGSLDKVYRKNEDGSVSTTAAGVAVEFDDGYDDIAYVGYMHGDFTGNSTSYDEANQNIKDSSIKSEVDEFYENFIENDTNNYHFEKYLSDTLFCGDKTLASGYSIENSGFGSIKTNYAAYERLAVAPVNPTLECAKGATNTYSRYTAYDEENPGRFNSSTTTTKGVYVNNDLKYPIALLSADELVMAGAWGGEGTTENNSYYLSDPYNYTISTSNDDWYTMSPVGNDLNEYSNWYVFGSVDKSLEVLTVSARGDGVVVVSGWDGVRPVINLKADTQIKNGNGTYESPYTIEEIVE